MKFNIIISYFFLLILAFAQIADSSSVTKSLKNRIQSLNRSNAKSTRRAKKSSTLTKRNLVQTMGPQSTTDLIQIFQDVVVSRDKSKIAQIVEFIMGFVCESVAIWPRRERILPE